MPRQELFIKQIVTGHFETDNGWSYSVIGLGEDGAVYRYDTKTCGWVKYSMAVTDVVTPERGKRRR